MGNVFVSGWTDGTIDTETGTSGYIFLAKFDVQGNVLWKKQFGPPRDIEVTAIRTDMEGSCYLVGETSLAFGGQQTFGRTDAFVVKFDAYGDLVWVHILGTSRDDRAEALAIDEQGFCYVTGSTRGILNPGSDSNLLGPFIAKYDTDGTLLWAKKLSLSRAQIGKAISIQPNGNIYTAGTSGYIAQFDPNGVLIDSSVMSLGYCTNSMTFDSQGNLYACGANQASGWTAHVQKHDFSGARLWRRTFRDVAWVGAKYIVICTDGSGDVLMGGCQAAGAGCQAFCRRFDSNGNQTLRYGHPGDICGNQVGVDGIGSCLLTGYTNYTNPSGGTLVAKLGIPGATAPMILEAEEGTVSQGEIVDCNENCSGSGLVNLNGPAGSTISWEASIDVSKPYTLVVFYTNGQETEISIDLTVNNNHAATLVLPPTGDWTIWQTVSTDIRLRRGNNTILIETTTDQGPYVDCLKLVNDTTNLLTGKTIECSAEDPNYPAQNVTDLSLGTCWQAEGFPQSLVIDLGQTYTIDKATLIGLNGSVYQYLIQVAECPCDQYSTVVDKTDNQAACSIASSYTDTFEPVSAQCIKLTITGGAEEQEDVIAIREFGVFTSPSAR
jgi:hypothetical protein